MTKVPTAVRDSIRDRLWERCDDLGWGALSDQERAELYERWTTDARIGGELANFMDPRKVRVYIKDTLVKPYVRERLSLNEAEIWHLLGLTEGDRAIQSYIKPHGRQLLDGRVICWGRSRDWKMVLMAAFERGLVQPTNRPFGVILIESGKTEPEHARLVVRDAASRLGIPKLVWVE